MSFAAAKPLILMSVLALTTGCATKITLGPISDNLRPAATVTGKVHVKPVSDEARITRFDNDYYSTISGASEKTPYISETNPADILGKSTINCLTQSGLIVTTGSTVPEDTDIVVSPRFKSLYIGTSVAAQNLALALSLATGMATTSDPYAAIVVEDTFENPKLSARTAATFQNWERSMLHFTKGGGAERSFRLVQENYCGWLQQKVAGFKADPAAADGLNKKEAAAAQKAAKN